MIIRSRLEASKDDDRPTEQKNDKGWKITRVEGRNKTTPVSQSFSQPSDDLKCVALSRSVVRSVPGKSSSSSVVDRESLGMQMAGWSPKVLTFKALKSLVNPAVRDERLFRGRRWGREWRGSRSGGAAVDLLEIVVVRYYYIGRVAKRRRLWRSRTDLRIMRTRKTVNDFFLFIKHTHRILINLNRWPDQLHHNPVDIFCPGDCGCG